LRVEWRAIGEGYSIAQDDVPAEAVVGRCTGLGEPWRDLAIGGAAEEGLEHLRREQRLRPVAAHGWVEAARLPVSGRVDERAAVDGLEGGRGSALFRSRTRSGAPRGE